MMQTCVVIIAVLAVITARPFTSGYYTGTKWTNCYRTTEETTEPTTNPFHTHSPTSEPYYTSSEPGPLERLKEALVNLGNKAEEMAFNVKYRVEDEALDFAGEVEESVVERVVDLADLIEDINDEHLQY